MNIEKIFILFNRMYFKKYHILTQKIFQKISKIFWFKILGDDMNFYLDQFKLIMDES